MSEDDGIVVLNKEKLALMNNGDLVLFRDDRAFCEWSNQNGHTNAFMIIPEANMLLELIEHYRALLKGIQTLSDDMERSLKVIKL